MSSPAWRFLLHVSRCVFCEWVMNGRAVLWLDRGGVFWRACLYIIAGGDVKSLCTFAYVLTGKEFVTGVKLLICVKMDGMGWWCCHASPAYRWLYNGVLSICGTCHYTLLISVQLAICLLFRNWIFFNVKNAF